LKTWIDRYVERRKKEFFQYISPEILERFESGEEIDVEEFSEMWINSYERKLLFPLFSDKLLLKQLKYSMNQAGYRKLYKYDVPKHYNDAIENMFLPELIERFEKLMEENE
jgi:hypothetical protein